MVVIITGGAYMLASLGQDSVIPPNVVGFLAIVLGVMLVANLATRRFAPHADGTLLPLAALLNGIGFVVIARLNEKLAWQQAAWTLIGVAGFCVTLMVL